MFSQRRKRPAAQLIASGAKRPRPSKSSMYSHGRAVFCRGDHKADKHKQWAALGAWFLGPKAENGDVLRDLLTQAVDAQIGFRHRWVHRDLTIQGSGQDLTWSFFAYSQKISSEFNPLLAFFCLFVCCFFASCDWFKFLKKDLERSTILDSPFELSTCVLFSLKPL